jgi:RHS repeat-associated protein
MNRVLTPRAAGLQASGFFLGPAQALRVQGNGQVRWRWRGEPFGASPAEEQPTAGLAPVQQQLRFPGQQYEAFGGRHYNHFRDYDPTVGRYVQSDPIGLAAGSMSTYNYVDANPLTGTDPLGLANGSAAQMWMKTPAPECPEDKCSNPVTLTFTTNNVCETGDVLCAQAMKAAGLQGPYFPQTFTGTYSLTCLAKFGLVGKGGFAAAVQVAGKHLPGKIANGLGRVGLPAAGAYAGAIGTTIAEVSSGPLGITFTLASAGAYLAEKCKCENDK